MANKKKVSVITKEVYHGGIEKELHDFKSFLWFTEEFDYAYGFGPNIICANIEVLNPFIVGNTDAYVKILGVKFSKEFETLASKLEMTAQELLDIYVGDKTNCKKIFNLVRTVEFRKLIESKGYDGVYTIEEGNNKCWGVLSTSQVTINSVDTEDEDEWYEKENRIIFKPNKPLEESISDELKIYTETTDAYDGQVDKIKYAYLGKTFVGYLQYSVYKDTPYIQMIEVAEDYKRQGIATKLLQSLQKDYPNKPIHTGWQTEEGSKLFDKVSVIKKNPVHSRYENELKKIDKQIEEIDKKWEEYYNSDMSTMTDEEVEELNKLDNKLEDRRYVLQKRLQDTEKSHRYIKEEYIEYNTPQRERSGLASTKVLITTSPYEVKNKLLSSKEPLRILYDSSKGKKLYMVGDANQIIHYDMLDAARENGYYDFPKWKLDSYVDDGLDNDTLYYVLYTPKGKDNISYGANLGEDDYDEKYVYDFGTITTRTSDWKKVPLSKALGAYNEHTHLGWKQDEWGEWVKNIRVVESLKESLNDAEDIDIEDIDYFSRGWILPNGKIISTYNGPHYENGHEYDDQSRDIRFNFGYERYIGLPDNVMPTNEQFKTLTTLLDYYFINADMVGIRSTEVEICYDMDNVGNFKTSVVSPKDYTSDELIKHIKRLLSSRETTEKLEQTVEENLSEEEKQKLDKIDNFIDNIYKLRQESIQKDGEFGIGNLVFKEFRNLGYLEYLKELKTRLESKNLSLEGLSDDSLTESISIDEVKELFTLDNFKKAAEEYIVEDPSTVSKCYIDPDGEIYNIGAIADTHASWVAQIFNKIYEQEKGKSWYSEFEDDEDIELQQFFDDTRELLDDWGFIQCSTDLGGYIAISKNPTGYQYLTLLDWLYGIMEKGSRSVEVSLFTNNWTEHRYNFSENYLPEDVIKSIKKAVATKGKLQESKEDNEKFRQWLNNDEVYNKFMSNKQRLKDFDYSTDIYWIMNMWSPEMVKDALSDLDNIATKKEKIKTAKEGSILLYNKNGIQIREILTYAASCKYGRGTMWCIANTYGNDSEYFDDYIASGDRIFIATNKHADEPEQQTIAIVVDKNGGHTIYDEVDYTIPWVKDFPTFTTEDGLTVDISKPEPEVAENFKKIGIDFNDVDYVKANYSEYFEDYFTNKPLQVYMKNGDVKTVQYWDDSNRIEDVTDEFEKFCEEEGSMIESKQ